MSRGKISVNPLSAHPTKLWEELSKQQNQKKIQLDPYTKSVCTQANDTVRFVLISDTHNKTDELVLPDGDVLIHAGDFTRRGEPKEIDHFNDFLQKQTHKFKHIIVICGNHELTFDPDPDFYGKKYLDPAYWHLDHKEMKKKLTNCTYIEDEHANVLGFNIYGSPWQPEFGGWAYNLQRGEECLEKWDLIPDNIDVLVTHGPPLGYGDMCFTKKRAGCAELLSTIQQRVKPKLHVFGHIHEAYGMWTDGTTTYVNASTCSLQYRPIHPPIIIDLPTVTVQ